MTDLGKSLLISLAFLAAMSSGASAQYITSPTTERAVPSGPLSPRSSAASDAMAEERIEALELRIAQLEQLLEAQNNLNARRQMTDAKRLGDRLDNLEAQMQGGGVSPAPVRLAPMPDSGAAAPADMGGAQTAELQMRYNDMAESLRLLQSQTDRLLLQMRSVEQALDRKNADNEFRFQALESGVRRANTGISSTSDETEVIGFVKRAAPVAALEGASAVASAVASASAGVSNAAQDRLVGEGDLSVLTDFGQPSRVALADPKALYERALGDLQAGNYAGAELDLAELLATHPAHELAGNAQYWLGETHYVRRQFKRAAQAFLSGYTTYEKSPKAPDSLLKLGMTLTALGEKTTGCDAFAELGAKFPDASIAVKKRADIERKRANCGS